MNLMQLLRTSYLKINKTNKNKLFETTSNFLQYSFYKIEWISIIVL